MKAKKKLTTRQLAEYGLLVALAMVLSYVEYLIPFSSAVPGVKLGLANIVVIFALYRLGPGPAAAISFVRVLLMTFMFGNAFALFYSLSGAVLSLTVMLLLKKTGKFSPVGVDAQHRPDFVRNGRARDGKARLLPAGAARFRHARGDRHWHRRRHSH